MRCKETNIYSYKFKSIVHNFWMKYRKVIIVLALISLFGILTGCFTVGKHSSSIESSNISNQTFVDFVEGDAGVWALFFKCILYYLVLCIIAIFLNIKPFCVTFNIVALIIYCYLSAFDITAFILLYGLSGILYSIFILIPFFIILLMIYIFISAIAINNNLMRSKFGKNCFCDFSLGKVYIILICVGVLILLLECNILPIVRYTII